MIFQRFTLLERFVKGLDSKGRTCPANGESIHVATKIALLYHFSSSISPPPLPLLLTSSSRYIEWGKSWSLLEGEDSSQTQYTASNVWNHPIDVHFASTSMLEWPRIIVQVWTLDSYGRSILAGYGFTHLPTNPGEHELEINCWKPTNGSIREKLEEFFLSRTPSCLLDEAVIFGKAWENRSQLTTVSSGKVKLNVNVVLRFFDQHNVK